MVIVFETREVALGKTGLWKAELQRVSDWRKGIAIAREKVYGSNEQRWNYHLIDYNYNFVFSKIWYNEVEIEGDQIERVFGGYYVVRDVRAKCIMTFPGKDEENHYIYTTYIQDVIDENGNILTEDERKKYLQTNSIMHTKEYGDGIVQCGSSFYRLDNYQYLFYISKDVEPLGFFRNGKCKVSVISDNRDFIVVVKDKKIQHAYNAETFLFISKLLGVDLEEMEKQTLKSYHETKHIPVRESVDISTAKTLKPEITTIISNYELLPPLPYSIDCYGVLYYDENYGFYRTQLIPTTCYYHIDNEWWKIDEADSKPIFDKIFEQKCNRPNFIKEIKYIAKDILLDEEEYSLFRFECRPYGYINKDGKFEYNFDVDNIEW